MRVTILNQYYPPDVAATATLAASLAEHWAREGHEVSVVASRGGYVGRSSSSSATDSTAVRVHRLWTPQFGKSTLVGRLADYAAFYILATWTMLMLPAQDVVVSLTTPPYIVLAALAHRWRSWRARIVLWNMDCYPEAPESVGMLRCGGLASRLMRLLNLLILRRVDRIVCLDSAMAELLQRNYGETRPLPITVIPNWEAVTAFPAEDVAPRPRARHDRSLVVLYQGNAGVGHEFDTVLECARLMRDDPVTFRFSGGGKWWGWLAERQGSADLPGWEVLPYVPVSEWRSLLDQADVSLITLRESSRGVMSPSKLHSSLAAGLPVLYVGPPGTNVDTCVQEHGCGISVRNGDAAAAVAFLRHVIESPDALSELSRRARRAFEAAYSDERTLPQFDALLDDLRSLHSPRIG